jgi:peptidoglycan/xylan/chitin deacetylase (PgdA/CDA1 family)
MHVVLTYDTEEPGQCIPKLRIIWDVHRSFDAPLTIFVVGRLLEEEGPDLKRMIDEAPGLWDVNSHSYSHARMLPKAPWSKESSSAEEVYEETQRGVDAVRRHLDQPCRGFRPRTGAGAGYRGWHGHLDALRSAGCTWVSAYLKSVFEDALPGDLHGPYTYGPDGFDDLIELPSHGWQDALLKPFRGLEALAVRWPSEHAYPQALVETPQEEFEVYRTTLNAAEAAGLPFCCLCLHPWTMIRDTDPGGKAIELVLDYARKQGWEVSTLDAEAALCREEPDRLVVAPEIPPQRTPGYDVARNFA